MTKRQRDRHKQLRFVRRYALEIAVEMELLRQEVREDFEAWAYPNVLGIPAPERTVDQEVQEAFERIQMPPVDPKVYKSWFGGEPDEAEKLQYVQDRNSMVLSALEAAIRARHA